MRGGGDADHELGLGDRARDALDQLGWLLDDPAASVLMSKPVRTVRPETTIAELTELMTVHDYNGFPER